MNPAVHADEDLRDLYRELILDHARNPRHFGSLPGATHSAEGINPLCGDKLHVYFAIDDVGRIRDARFEGTGCAISVASASLLTDTVIGMHSGEALGFFAALVARLTGKDATTASADVPPDLGKLAALEGVREFPSRVKCATLAWHALRSAIRHESPTVTTE